MRSWLEDLDRSLISAETGSCSRCSCLFQLLRLLALSMLCASICLLSSPYSLRRLTNSSRRSATGSPCSRQTSVLTILLVLRCGGSSLAGRGLGTSGREGLVVAGRCWWEGICMREAESLRREKDSELSLWSSLLFGLLCLVPLRLSLTQKQSIPRRVSFTYMPLSHRVWSRAAASLAFSIEEREFLSSSASSPSLPLLNSWEMPSIFFSQNRILASLASRTYRSISCSEGECRRAKQKGLRRKRLRTNFFMSSSDSTGEYLASREEWMYLRRWCRRGQLLSSWQENSEAIAWIFLWLSGWQRGGCPPASSGAMMPLNSSRMLLNFWKITSISSSKGRQLSIFSEKRSFLEHFRIRKSAISSAMTSPQLSADSKSLRGGLARKQLAEIRAAMLARFTVQLSAISLRKATSRSAPLKTRLFVQAARSSARAVSVLRSTAASRAESCSLPAVATWYLQERQSRVSRNERRDLLFEMVFWLASRRMRSTKGSRTTRCSHFLSAALMCTAVSTDDACILPSCGRYLGASPVDSSMRFSRCAISSSLALQALKRSALSQSSSCGVQFCPPAASCSASASTAGSAPSPKRCSLQMASVTAQGERYWRGSSF